jgi:hypothetical protein
MKNNYRWLLRNFEPQKNPEYWVLAPSAVLNEIKEHAIKLDL